MPAGKLEGKPFVDFIWPEDRERVVANYRKRIAGETISDAYDFRIIGAGGRLTWVYLSAAAIPWKGKTATLNLVTDITERKRQEEENWKARQIVEGVLNSIQVRVFWKDLNLTFLGCNTPFARDAGFEKPEDIIGRDDFAMGWREQADLYRSDDRRVIESGMPKLFIEEPQKTPSGDTISLLTTKIPLRDAGGNVIGVMGTYIDITERKRAEEALRTSEQKLNSILNNITDVVWSLSWPDMKVHYISPSAEQVYGRSVQEFIDKPSLWAEVVHPDDRQISDTVLEELQKTGSAVRECRIVRPDGSIAWILDRSKFIYDEYGNPVRAEGITSDITERKQAEEALREANKKLNLLSSITRHDINNQMTALRGYTTMLQRKQPDSSFAEYFQKINAAAERISSMIQFTREYESIGVTAPVWQDCRIVVDTAAKQTTLGQVMVKNDLPASGEIFADPLVVKVFYNLLDNAVRYGGKITTIRFSAEEHDGDHVVVCEDDGDGVIAKEKEKIFERGFGKNTGLGLALSREILSITGITIRETGEPGKGARFEMTVPKEAWRMKRDGA